MSFTQGVGRTQSLQTETRDAIDGFNKLGTDEKLALLYFIYEKMGSSVTPAAPTAAEPDLAPMLLGDFYELSQEEQLAVMREIVDRRNTDYSRAYGALTENNQLVVWYAWAQGMGKTVVGMPGGSQASGAVKDALGQLETLGFEHQISLLREVANNMGHTDVQPIPTQAETGKTSSL